uniref:(northern house mosquito) hypothetical protein n=1 Tax=Culex pipiens TaxID=7175 RepID=A0A8D8DCC0_CULPI
MLLLLVATVDDRVVRRGATGDRTGRFGTFRLTHSAPTAILTRNSSKTDSFAIDDAILSRRELLSITNRIRQSPPDRSRLSTSQRRRRRRVCQSVTPPPTTPTPAVVAEPVRPGTPRRGRFRSRKIRLIDLLVSRFHC